MQKNVAGQKIGAQLVSASDGSAFTGAVTVEVTIDAGTQTTGSVGSGACTHEGNGYHTYAPSQAETNGTLIAFTFHGTGAVPVTVQVFTTGYDPTAAQLPANVTQLGGVAQSLTDLKDFVDTGYDPATHKVEEVKVLTGHTVQTGDSYAIVNSGVHGNAALKALIDTIDAIVDAILVDTGTDIPGLLSTIAGYLDTEIAAIKGKTDNLPAAPAATGDVTTARDVVLAKLLKYVQLLARKDAAIGTDNAAEKTAINADGGSGAGSFDQQTDSQEAIRDNMGTLTAGERTAIANEVEAQIIDETDSEKVLTAITDKIASVNPSLGSLTLAAIAAAVRDQAYAGASAGSIGAALAALAARLPGSGTLAIATDIPSAAANADAVWDEARSGHANAGSFGEGVKVEALNTQARADVNTEADAALADIGATSAVMARIDVDISTRLAASGYTAPLDAAGIRAALGLASPNLDTQLGALPTNAELATALAAADDAVLAAIAALNNLSQSDVRSAVGLSSANLDTQLALLATYIDTEVAAIKARTDNLPADTAATLATLQAAVSAIKVITDALTAAAAGKLALSALGIIPGTVDDAGFLPTTTEFEASDITEATDDHYLGRIITFTSGALLGQSTDITDYSLVGGRAHFTVTALTEAAGTGATFVIT